MARRGFRTTTGTHVKSRRSSYQDVSSVYQQTRIDNGQIIDITLEDFNRAYLEAQAAEVRKALRGAKGYQTKWPRPRYNRRGRKPSRQMFKVQPKFRPRARKMYIFVRHRQRHGHLLETEPVIRGYDNIHWRAGVRSIQAEWHKITRNASTHTERRARGRAIRRYHAQQRAEQKTAELDTIQGRLRMFSGLGE